MAQYTAIVSQGRSGSNLLQYLLGSHPQITMFGELFHPDRVVPRIDQEPGDDPTLDYPKQSIRSIEEYLVQRLDNHNQVVGFKMPWDWLLVYPETWAAFFSLGFRLLYLRRRNKVDQYLSMRLARENSNWLSVDTYKNQRLHVHPLELHAYWAISQRTDSWLENMCARAPVIEVAYEDIVNMDQQDDILDFLGVAHIRLIPHTIRSRTKTKAEVIENYDSLLEYFRGHPLEQQLLARD